VAYITAKRSKPEKSVFKDDTIFNSFLLDNEYDQKNIYSNYDEYYIVEINQIGQALYTIANNIKDDQKVYMTLRSSNHLMAIIVEKNLNNIKLSFLTRIKPLAI
jgi:hypothetical protein